MPAAVHTLEIERGVNFFRHIELIKDDDPIDLRGYTGVFVIDYHDGMKRQRAISVELKDGTSIEGDKGSIAVEISKEQVNDLPQFRRGDYYLDVESEEGFATRLMKGPAVLNFP